MKLILVFTGLGVHWCCISIPESFVKDGSSVLILSYDTVGFSALSQPRSQGFSPPRRVWAGKEKSSPRRTKALGTRLGVNSRQKPAFDLFFLITRLQQPR